MKKLPFALFVLTATSLLSDTLNADGKWVVLFNGKSTDALRGYKMDSFPSESWKVVDGALKTVVEAKHVDIITKDSYDNFELEFEWKVSPGGNSGVMYNVREGKGPAYHSGPELQILDDDKHGDGRNPKTSAGSLYALVAPNAEKKLKPVGEFNHTRLLVKNGHVEHWVNGKKVVEYEWASPAVKTLIADSKFKAWPEFMTFTSGHIVFQHHGQEVWFRNIRVRKL